jgi:D-glycero-D-manno-heptose 1,7-bisphosphate phosphatase
VLNEAVHYPNWGLDSPARPQDLRLYPDAARAVRTVREWGFLALLCSNQPGAAKGKYPLENFRAVDRMLDTLLTAGGAKLDGRFYCLHHPNAILAEYRMVCDCRKPKAGLLLRAAAEFELDLSSSYFIGDTKNDMGAAHAAGCMPLLLVRAKSSVPGRSQVMVEDLDQALQFIGRREDIHVT